MLSGLQYVPSNFAPNYGNATGGIVVLTPRVGRRDGVHGHAKLDLISAGAQVEGPSAAARSSSPPSAATSTSRSRPWASSPSTATTSAPSTATTRSSSITPSAPARPSPPASSGPATSSASLALLRRRRRDPQLRLPPRRPRLQEAQRTVGLPALPALRLDTGGLETGIQMRRRTDVIGLLRAELTARPSRRFQLTLGADTQIDRHRTRSQVESTQGTIDSSQDLPETFDEVARGTTTTSGVYLTPLLAVGRFTVSPGLRASLFTGLGEPQFSVDPRLHARWAPHPRVAVQLGAGRYSQPSFRSLSTVPAIGNFSAIDSLGLDPRIVLPAALRYLDPRINVDPRSLLGLMQAVQLSANVHLRLTAGLGLDITGFWRRDRDRSPLVDYFGQPIVDRGAAVHGLEVMLRQDLTRRLFGWVAYTLMRARTGTFDAHDRLALRVPNDFDQRHNLVAVLGVKLPRRWQIAGRFRLVTGLPFTPVVGGVKADGPFSATYPVYGAYNSARMPVFHQLDIRVDKTWVRSRTIVSTYLDVQNIYNRQNAEGLWYLTDYSGTQTVVGVPILPVIGVRVEY
ncbi:hypothetical protein [Nannocystis pusilla]|uniref:hypothetical protein n=1 Tax=Nannocystis pusilla TaxID=889268 RepID=UPI003B7CCB46